MSDALRITAEVDLAHEHRSPWEAITVTFECGHLTLMTKNSTVMGVGATGGCRMCWTSSIPDTDATCSICLSTHEVRASRGYLTDADLRAYRMHHEIVHHGGSVPRMVCKLEPTGHLHDEFLKRKSDA